MCDYDIEQVGGLSWFPHMVCERVCAGCVGVIVACVCVVVLVGGVCVRVCACVRWVADGISTKYVYMICVVVYATILINRSFIVILSSLSYGSWSWVTPPILKGSIG